MFLQCNTGRVDFAEGNPPASAAGAGAGEPTRSLQKRKKKNRGNGKKDKNIRSISQPGRGRREQKTGKCFTSPGKR